MDYKQYDTTITFDQAMVPVFYLATIVSSRNVVEWYYDSGDP